MKPYLILICLVGLLACKTSAQTNTATTDTTVWGSVQSNYPGGQDAYNQFVTDHALYPKLALNGHIMGSVYVSLIIEENGSISNLKVVHDIGSQTDEAAVNLVSHSGKWAPKVVDGKPVRTMCIAPVNYVISTNHNHEVFGIINGLPPQTSLTSVPIAPNSIIVFPPLIALKDIRTYLGLMVMIKDVVNGHHKEDKTETLDIGAQHLNMLLTVILSDEAFEAYKNKNLDGKTISFAGTPEVTKDGYQLLISNPSYISIYKH